MTPEERCQYALENGYTYNPQDGTVTGPMGSQLSNRRGEYLSMAILPYGKKGTRYSILQHRFAWYATYGYLPKYIDHKNRDGMDNRIDNLREVTNSQNAFNCKNTKGYTFSKAKNRYKASIMVNGKSKTIGYYQTEEAASEAYLKAKLNLHKI